MEDIKKLLENLSKLYDILENDNLDIKDLNYISYKINEIMIDLKEYKRIKINNRIINL